jgi:hypothetical protein
MINKGGYGYLIIRGVVSVIFVPSTNKVASDNVVFRKLKISLAYILCHQGVSLKVAT